MTDQRQHKDEGMEVCYECLAVHIDPETESWMDKHDDPDVYRAYFQKHEGDRRLPIRFCPQHYDKIREMRPLDETERNALRMQIAEEYASRSEK